MKNQVIPADDDLGHVAKVIINAPALYMGAGTVIGGAAAAGMAGHFEFMPAMVCLIFAMFAQVASNAIYRYLDSTRDYGDSDDKIGFVRLDDVSMSEVIKSFAVAALILCGMTGLTIAAMAGWWCLIVGLVLVLFAWFSNTGMRPLMKSPVNLAVTFLVFGPFGVIVTALVQLQHHAPDWTDWSVIEPGVYVGVCMGFMAVNSHLVYGYFNYRNDVLNARRTGAMLFGLRNTRRVVATVGMLAMLSLSFLDSIVEPMNFMSAEWWLLTGVGVAYMLVCVAVARRMRLRGRSRQGDLRTYMNLAMFMAGLAVLAITLCCRV